jgi:monofunctional biosynthetic peptidoglycan transglycosylase
MRTILTLAFVGFIVWFIPWVFVFSFGAVVYFPYEPDGHSRYARLTGPLAASVSLDKDWADASDIRLQCRAAVIAAEDGKFLEHNGVDTESIEKALERNRKKGKIKRGGSTVTQQLVKNVFLYRDKTYFRKAREIVGAVLLDLVMNKEDQITWYLNVVEFGPRIYGIKPAAKYYFNKEVKKLTLPECALLVGILRDPIKSSRGLKSKEIPAYLRLRQQKIVDSVYKSGVISQLQAAN